MKLAIVLRVVSAISVVVGLVILTAAPIAMVKDDMATAIKFVESGLIPIVLGSLGILVRSKTKDVRFREGFGIVTFSWLAASIFGAIPFMLIADLSFVDAWFETMSGFTTTGASILGDASTPTIESLPQSLLYWRSMTHWLGGMGIVVLSLAILPILGIGGMQMYKAEAPGPTSDQLAPRIASTAKLLWAVYLLITVVETILLAMSPEMDLLEAWNHACATVATGGFSTRNGSIADFNSAYIEWVIIIFMFLAGTNFALHLRTLTGKPLSTLKDEEFRFFGMIILFGISTIAIDLYVHDTYQGFSTIIRHSSFAVLSIITTTGFGTENWDSWPFYCRALILMLMFFGGCGGSTAGGMKVSRILLLFKYSISQLRKSYYPRMLTNIRLNNLRIGDTIIERVLSFTMIYIFIWVIVGILVTVVEPNLHALHTSGGTIVAVDEASADRVDAHTFGGLETAFGASIACLSNIGPGLGQVGPAMNFGWMGDFSKIILTFAMLIGRLEVYTVIVLLLPSFWRD